MRILITGGTGSLGHALVRYYLNETDHRVVILSRDELKQAQMHERFNDPRLDFRLGDVRDIRRLKLALYGVDVVIHAAALKRVDAVAGDPVEVFHTNIKGTHNVLEAALANEVPKIVLVSSDKACAPSNAYGASKFAAECLTVAFNTYSAPRGTVASVVRYGNVLGSRGSVVHVWRAAARKNHLFPITDPGMTRFILTLEQACETIQFAVDHMQGGEIFVPRLKSAYVTDIGRAIQNDAAFYETGLRPGGEKMDETMMTAEESSRGFVVDKSYEVIAPHLRPWTSLPGWWETYERSPRGEMTSFNVDKLSVSELRRLLSRVPEDGI